MGEPRSVSLICIHAHGIPEIFPAEAVQEAERAQGVTLRGREDLRAIPLLTIDGEDARDFDDAVWAAPEGTGWRVIVAIADVAHYVRPGSALDREAWARGNSVYFPDRVVPMLPEQLSADVCSLRAGQDRAAMACHMVIDAKGQMVSWRFSRAVIKVAANIPYEDAQAAIDGVKPHDLTEVALRPLWACWALLFKAREKRAPRKKVEMTTTRKLVNFDVANEFLAFREGGV
jgi:ribonuclease R